MLLVPAPYVNVEASSLFSTRLMADLLFGIENDVDFVAASFVSNKENVCELRKFLDENGGKEIDIIAKIENRAGVDNIDEICEIADGTRCTARSFGW